METHLVAAYINIEVYNKMKHRCIDTKMKMREFVMQAITEKLSKESKKSK